MNFVERPVGLTVTKRKVSRNKFRPQVRKKQTANRVLIVAFFFFLFSYSLAIVCVHEEIEQVLFISAQELSSTFVLSEGEHESIPFFSLRDRFYYWCELMLASNAYECKLISLRDRINSKSVCFSFAYFFAANVGVVSLNGLNDETVKEQEF